jgi:hypothetical protein
MKTNCWMALAGLMALTLATLAPAQAPKADEYTFSGPYTYQNLSIFLVHGKDTLPAKKLLTLQEALEQKKLVVHETKQVGQLSVENIADDFDVFIQSGDIVKGGQQDRALGYDLIVSAKSGKVPIQSFCVEQGRWSQRGSENAAQFDKSDYNANGKEFKKAINFARKQDEVWAQVKAAQMKLAKNVGQSVQGKDSATSLQLTLEDKKLLESVDKYVKELAKIAEGKKDAIGYVVAVNGKIDGADIYGSAALFEKIWPRLIKGSATDALAEFEKDKKFAQPTVDNVKAFLNDANQGKKETSKDVSPRVQVSTKEADKNLVIECKDRQNGGQIIHKNYIAK